MSSRQTLDTAVKRVTGEDIRLVGNWQPLPGLADHVSQLADYLGLPENRLRQCADITDILNLLETAAPPSREESSSQASLF